MKIRRKLFISNILMIVIPLIVSLAVFHAGLFAYTALTGIRDNRRFRDGAVFYRYRTMLSEMAREWRADPDGPDLERIKRDVGEFNTEVRGGLWPLMLVYQNGWLVYPEGTPFYDSPIQSAAMSDSGTMILSGMTSFTEAADDWRVVLVDSWTHVQDESADYRSIMRTGSIYAVIASIFVILITNQFLTRFIFRGIVGSLDALTNGVREISEGHLGYRMSYEKDDEFAPVCDDFNAMASRLEASEQARARDERSRRELIAGISHDLRTPLTSIKAYVEGIRHGVAATEEARDRYLATIEHKSDDLEHIIDMLFLFSKEDTGELQYDLERLPLGALVSEAVASLRDEYRQRGVDIETTFADESDEACAVVDAVRSRSVIANVVSNSVKYCARPDIRIDVRVSREDDMLIVTMTDNGPGVPEDQLDRIFDVFTRLDPARSDPSRGSGLGLAISSKVISHLGGSIRAENAQEGGLRIIIALPAAEGS